MARMMPAFQEITTVAMPFVSNPRAISPTDWQQIGQEGTSSAACACSLFANCRMAGKVSLTTRDTSGW